jgi:NTE family protein
MTSKRTGKTALVLAGGGFTGAVYEIGALRAIDDLLVDLSVNDFDIYVGTSAGALVSTFLANGISPEEMFTVIEGTNREIRSIVRQDIFHLNRRDLLKWGVGLPKNLTEAWFDYLRHITDMTVVDLLWSLSDVLPTGLYDGLGLENYISNTLAKLGINNNFQDLNHQLYIIATDLDTGKRAIFGPDALEAPVSMAVTASSAVPLLYKPVCINGREYIDGGMRGAASIDLAIERGARLVVCINPLVPFDYSRQGTIIPTDVGVDHLSSMGIQSIFGQTLRIFSHASLDYHIKQLRRSHPQVDIILIEPKPDDYQMFFNNIMRYSARLIVAHHGFISITLDLAKEYSFYKETLARHGIRISRRLVNEELAEIENSGYDPEVIRRIMEASRIGCRPHNPKTALCQLSRTLADLEAILDDKTLARQVKADIG